MAPITQQDLEQRFAANESVVRRRAKLATIAEDPEPIMEMSLSDLIEALGGDAAEITVGDFIAAFSQGEDEHTGNGTRLVGAAREQVKQEILKLLEHYGGLGCRDVSQMLGLPSRKVGAVLRGMRDDGLIKSSGRKVGTVYYSNDSE